MGEHTTDSAPEDTGRSLVVEGTLAGVGIHTLAEEVSPKHLVAEKRTRDVKLLSADTNDTLAVKKLLSNKSSKTTDEVALTINDNNLRQTIKKTKKIEIFYPEQQGRMEILREIIKHREQSKNMHKEAIYKRKQ